MCYFSLFSLIYARREGDPKPPPLTAYCFISLTIINDDDAAPVQGTEVQGRVGVVQGRVDVVQGRVGVVQVRVGVVQVRVGVVQVQDAVAPERDGAAPEEAARDDEDVVPVRVPAACTCTRLL